MKQTILAVFLLVLSGQLSAQEVIRLSEPVKVTTAYEVFGSLVDESLPVTSLSSVIDRSADYTGKEVVVTATVKEVCSKKGCFFIAEHENKIARVTFVDYSFFVPTDTDGKEVRIFGVFEEKELSEEKAKHYAEDAGQDPSKISGAQKEYAIVAKAVIIPKYIK